MIKSTYIGPRLSVWAPPLLLGRLRFRKVEVGFLLCDDVSSLELAEGGQFVLHFGLETVKALELETDRSLCWH